MSLRCTRRVFSIRVFIAFTICSLLLLLPCTPFILKSDAQGVSAQTSTAGARPEPGPPAATLPNIDEVKRRRPEIPVIAEPLPSTSRSKRSPEVPYDGRTVGEPIQREIAPSPMPASTAPNL